MRTRPPRVLVTRLSALGDVIHALPVLGLLREALPDATIDWVVEDRAASLLAGRSEIDRVVVFPRRELRALARRPVAWTHRVVFFLLELRAHRYDASLDLQGNLKSGVIARLSGARQRFGLERRLSREGNHLFTTLRIRPPREARHRVERNLALAARMVGRAPVWHDPGLPQAPAAAARARDLLAQAGVDPDRPYVVLHPGTSAFGAFKRWPPERFADLAGMLADRGEQVVVSAPPGEESLAHEVAARADDAAVVVTVEGLDVLGELVRGASRFVAADTGPLHLAALAGTPLVGLFGPKDAATYGPWGRRRDGAVGLLPVLGREDVACRPCGRRACADPVCMTGIEAEAVLTTLDA